MDKEKIKDEINDFLERTVVDSDKHVNVIVFRDEVDKWLHISPDPKIKEFIPTVSRRTMNVENRSVPRVSVSTTISGCLAGFSDAEYDFTMMQPEKKGFRGGYYIYSINADAGIKPSKKLQPDVKSTNEHWLVPYNKDTWRYSAKKIGKVFLYELSTYGAIGYNDNYISTYAMEVFSGESVVFFDKPLEAGYWKIIITEIGHYKNSGARATVAKLTKKEYMDMKSVNASMLSWTDW